MVNWCAAQRRRMVKGKLSQDQIARLEALGFDFDPQLTQWEAMFLSLVEYKDEHGDCNVPHQFSQNPTLATWCNNQRRTMKKGKMSQDRIARLESIGFKWSFQ